MLGTTENKGEKQPKKKKDGNGRGSFIKAFRAHL